MSIQHIHRLLPQAAPTLRDRDLLPLSMEALNSHLWALGASGTGKTSAIVDMLLWFYFYHGLPCIVMTPVSTLTRRLVWHLARQPRYLQPYPHDKSS